MSAVIQSDVTHRVVETNGIRMHIVERGTGPLVILLHGFPEVWYSWRHQLSALADTGYHVVAPDQRGYGQTDRPKEVEKYTQLHLIGDVVGLMDALGETQAVVAGHDWGASIAWGTALLRPDRVRGVIGLSVPYVPRGEASVLTTLRAALGEGFYIAYFQKPGVAEAELERDVRTTVRKLLYSASGDVPITWQVHPVAPAGGGVLDVCLEPETLPAWLEAADLDFYVEEFTRTGFAGGLNWYRTVNLSWELMAPWQGAPLSVPALYIAGERDLVLNFPGMKQLIPALPRFLPNLRRTVILPGCGHWTQQERPTEVNAAMIEFLEALPVSH